MTCRNSWNPFYEMAYQVDLHTGINANQRGSISGSDKGRFIRRAAGALLVNDYPQSGCLEFSAIGRKGKRYVSALKLNFHPYAKHPVCFARINVKHGLAPTYINTCSIILPRLFTKPHFNRVEYKLQYHHGGMKSPVTQLLE